MPFPAHPRTDQSPPARSSGDGQGGILLVEDNLDDEMLTLRALGRHGGLRERVQVVRDGAEALDFVFARGAHTARHAADRLAVILLDLKLPKLNGLDVLRALRADERTRSQPIVILTSSREEQDLLRGYALGANSYVRKPVDFVEFRDAIRQVVLYWSTLNELPPR